jgi:hypothetical protein
LSISFHRSAAVALLFSFLGACVSSGDTQGEISSNTVASDKPLAASGTLSVESVQRDRGAPTLAPSLAPRPAPSLISGLASEAVEAPLAGGAGGELDLGTVAGEALTGADLIAAWHALSSRDLWLVVDKLVATRLARAEAGRLGLVLPPELIEREFGVEYARLAQDVEASAAGVPIEEFIAGRLGVDPQNYFEIMRAATIERMLTERVARAWVLAQESRAVRMVVVEVNDVGSLREELEGGADMEQVARDRSLDDSGPSGGLIPFLVNTDGSPLAQAAFAAAVGELVGPLSSGEVRLFLRVEGINPARPGTWAQVGESVEASLALIPLEDSEYVPWKLAMERSWPIDLEPLGKLVGAIR